MYTIPVCPLRVHSLLTNIHRQHHGIPSLNEDKPKSPQNVYDRVLSNKGGQIL